MKKNKKVESILSEAYFYFERLNDLEKEFNNLSDGGSLFHLNGYERRRNFNDYCKNEEHLEANYFDVVSEISSINYLYDHNKSHVTNRRELIEFCLKENHDGCLIKDIKHFILRSGFKNKNKTDLGVLIFHDLKKLVDEEKAIRIENRYHASD